MRKNGTGQAVGEKEAAWQARTRAYKETAKRNEALRRICASVCVYVWCHGRRDVEQRMLLWCCTAEVSVILQRRGKLPAKKLPEDARSQTSEYTTEKLRFSSVTVRGHVKSVLERDQNRGRPDRPKTIARSP